MQRTGKGNCISIQKIVFLSAHTFALLSCHKSFCENYPINFEVWLEGGEKLESSRRFLCIVQDEIKIFSMRQTERRALK